MKFVILALLVGSLIAVSPSALDQHYDDMLHNNLSTAMTKMETEAEQVNTHPIILPLAKPQILRLTAENMEKEDFENSQTIIRKVIDEAKTNNSYSTYHAFFTAMDYKKGEARTYELTIVRKDTALVGILTKKTHEIDVEEKYSFYYETYNSQFGLPFIFTEKAPIFDSNMTKDQINYMRQYLLKAAQQTRGSSIHDEKRLQAGWAAWAMAASKAIKSLTDAAKAVIDTFKTIKTKTLKDHIKGEGFSSYKASSNYSRILGVPIDKYEEFRESYKVMMGLKDSVHEAKINAFLNIAQWSVIDWKLDEFIFHNKNDKSQEQNVCDALVTVNRIDYEENRVHFITVKVKGFFELSDDILVYHKDDSIFGGIYQSKTDVLENKPRNITTEEIQAIQALMILNAMNVYADKMDFDFKPVSDKDIE